MNKAGTAMISVDYKIVSSLEKVFCGKTFDGKVLEVTDMYVIIKRRKDNK